MECIHQLLWLSSEPLAKHQHHVDEAKLIDSETFLFACIFYATRRSLNETFQSTSIMNMT